MLAGRLGRENWQERRQASFRRSQEDSEAKQSQAPEVLLWTGPRSKVDEHEVLCECCVRKETPGRDNCCMHKTVRQHVFRRWTTMPGSMGKITEAEDGALDF